LTAAGAGQVDSVTALTTGFVGWDGSSVDGGSVQEDLFREFHGSQSFARLLKHKDGVGIAELPPEAINGFKIQLCGGGIAFFLRIICSLHHFTREPLDLTNAINELLLKAIFFVTIEFHKRRL
jgi:hypothetical protein